MKTNSVIAWVKAARPQTLPAATVPVLLGGALAVRDSGGTLKWIPALLCLLFALSMQVLANFINDYFDFKKGTDNEDRLGPERACAQGWITLHAMQRGIFICATIASIVGLPLIYYGGWLMCLVGVSCLLFALLYTTTCSYIALGDLLVILCFGLIPVAFTYYLQLGSFTVQLWLLAFACGLVVNTLLVLNNYRDRATDQLAGKKTLVVVLGEKKGAKLYLWCGLLGAELVMLLLLWMRHYNALTLLPLIYIFLHYATFLKMCKINAGKELNLILKDTARNILIFGLLTTITILIS